MLRLKPKAWNEESIAILRAMGEARHSTREIADKLKRTEKSVAYMLEKQGIYRGRRGVVFWTAERIEILRAGIEGGGTLEQVAAAVGTTPVATARRANLMGWRRPPSPAKAPRRRETDWTDEQVETLRRLAAEGRTTDEIARKIGRTHCAVYKKAKNLGIAIVAAARREGPNMRVVGGIRTRPITSMFNDPSHLRHIGRFLRERGYGLTYTVTGSPLLDGREIDAKELIAVANRNKRLMGKPEFPEEIRETIPDKHSEDTGISFGAAA